MEKTHRKETDLHETRKKISGRAAGRGAGAGGVHRLQRTAELCHGTGQHGGSSGPDEAGQPGFAVRHPAGIRRRAHRPVDDRGSDQPDHCGRAAGPQGAAGPGHRQHEPGHQRQRIHLRLHQWVALSLVEREDRPDHGQQRQPVL